MCVDESDSRGGGGVVSRGYIYIDCFHLLFLMGRVWDVFRVDSLQTCIIPTTAVEVNLF